MRKIIHLTKTLFKRFKKPIQLQINEQDKEFEVACETHFKTLYKSEEGLAALDTMYETARIKKHWRIV